MPNKKKYVEITIKTIFLLKNKSSLWQLDMSYLVTKMGAPRPERSFGEWIPKINMIPVGLNFDHRILFSDEVKLVVGVNYDV